MHNENTKTSYAQRVTQGLFEAGHSHLQVKAATSDVSSKPLAELSLSYIGEGTAEGQWAPIGFTHQEERKFSRHSR